MSNHKIDQVEYWIVEDIYTYCGAIVSGDAMREIKKNEKIGTCRASELILNMRFPSNWGDEDGCRSQHLRRRTNEH